MKTSRSKDVESTELEYPCLATDGEDIFLLVGDNEGTIVDASDEDNLGKYADDWDGPFTYYTGKVTLEND